MDPLLLRTIRGEIVERPPVWIMRQAGRYMQEYRDLKEKHSFLEICRTAELSVEAAMQPINFLDVDAAILFSDILIPLEPMGIEIDFNPGPQIRNPIKTSSDISALKTIDSAKSLSFVDEAIRTLKSQVQAISTDKAIIGFAGSPWTLACYALDRGPFKHFENASIFAAEHPEAMHALLEKLSDSVIDFLRLQANAGAQVLQIFDSWGGNLSQENYQRWSLPYIQKIISEVGQTGALTTLYVGNSHHLLPVLASAEADCISVDWRTSLDTPLDKIQASVAVQGNLNPALLYSPKEEVTRLTREMINSWPEETSFVANLGHGILQTTPPENAKAFVDEVKKGWAK